MSVIEHYPVASYTSTGATGVWEEVDASTSADSNYIHISFGYKTPSSYRICLADIGIGGSGSEVPIIENLASYRSVAQDSPIFNYFIPVNIPAGSRLSIRPKDYGTGVDTTQVLITTYSESAHDYDNLDYLGVVTASAAATSVKGSWGQVSASVAENYDAIMVAQANNSVGVSSGTSWIDIGKGAAASETVIMQNLQSERSSNMDVFNPPVFHLMPVALDSGDRLVARIANTVSDPITVFVYGLRAPAVAGLARMDQIVAEAAGQLDASTVNARLTQQYAEVLLKPFTALTRMDQMVAEVAAQQAASTVNARLTQQYAEVLLRPGTVGSLAAPSNNNINLALGIMI